MGMRCTFKGAYICMESAQCHLWVKIRSINAATTENLLVEDLVRKLLQSIVFEWFDNVGVHKLQRSGHRTTLHKITPRTLFPTPILPKVYNSLRCLKGTVKRHQSYLSRIKQRRTFRERYSRVASKRALTPCT